MNKKPIPPELMEEWTSQRLSISDYTLSDIDLSRRCPLDNGLHTSEPKHGLGNLSLLPLEILTDVFLELDVLSMTTFRRVNKGAAQLVESIPHYQMIFRHCPDILRYIISTKAGYFNLRTLHRALCKLQCETCGEFGGYLYLITYSRVCYDCFTNNRWFLPMSGKQAPSVAGCSRKKLRYLPHIWSIPGRYAVDRLSYRQRQSLWDWKALLSVQKPLCSTK